MTDDDLIALWAFESRSRVSDPILIEYTRYVREFRTHTGKPLRDATALEAKGFILTNSGRWAPGTLQMARRSLRSLYRWLHDQGLIAENIALAIPAVKCPEVPVRVAGADVRDTLVGFCLSVHDVAMVEVIFGTGCRRGECVALTVDDVSVADRAISIRKSKTGRPRVAPLDPRATAAVAAWLTEREGLAPATSALWVVTTTGLPLTQHGAKTVFRRLSKRAGLTFGTHDARRGYATRWLAAGGTETGLQSVCGWSSTQMIYALHPDGAGEAGARRSEAAVGMTPNLPPPSPALWAPRLRRLLAMFLAAQIAGSPAS